MQNLMLFCSSNVQKQLAKQYFVVDGWQLEIRREFVRQLRLFGEEHARSFLSFRARNLLQIGPLHLRRFFVLVRIYQTRTPRYPDFLERSRHSRPPRALSSDSCFRETKIIKFINPKTTRKSISNTKLCLSVKVY